MIPVTCIHECMNICPVNISSLNSETTNNRDEHPTSGGAGVRNHCFSRAYIYISIYIYILHCQLLIAKTSFGLFGQPPALNAEQDGSHKRCNGGLSADTKALGSLCFGGMNHTNMKYNYMQKNETD